MKLVELISQSSDATLMLNLISPYLMGERKGKLSKLHSDFVEIIKMLVINQMKIQNDLRALLLYLNKKEVLELDDEDVPNLMSSPEPDSLYC